MTFFPVSRDGLPLTLLLRQCNYPEPSPETHLPPSSSCPLRPCFSPPRESLERRPRPHPRFSQSHDRTPCRRTILAPSANPSGCRSPLCTCPCPQRTGTWRSRMTWREVRFKVLRVSGLCTDSRIAQKHLRELKSKISSQSKKNFVLEKDVRYLDSRIALLIQNRMALEEVRSNIWNYYHRELVTHIPAAK